MITVISKDNCPWCTKAIELLEDEGFEYKVVKVKSTTELNDVLPAWCPRASTVPQIFSNHEYIGGYEDLKLRLHKAHPSTNRTVFNTKNTGYETGDYPLFLGEQLGFTDTINTPYPILDQLYQTQLSQIWNESEIDLTQDRQDMLTAPPEVVGLMTKTIMWQHLADSIASRAITGILMEYVSNSDLEAWYNCVALFETIHARTYSHIVKQTFLDPNEALQQGYADLDVVKRADIIRASFDNLANMSQDAPMLEKQEKVYLAAVALYMLEKVSFMASFAITFGIAETGIFSGIAQDVTLICRDELLHARGGEEVLKIEMKRNPELFKKLAPKIEQLYNAIVQAELDWTDYLFSSGRQVIGLNPERVKQYVLYMAGDAAELLGLPYEKVEKNPLPYMENYTNSSKVQVAPQEMQLTSYLVNSVLPAADIDATLDELRKEFAQ